MTDLITTALPAPREEHPPVPGARRAGWSAPRAALGAALRSVLRSVLRSPGLLAAAVVVGFVLVAAFAPGVIAPGDPLTGVVADKLQPPSAAHVFGTDYLGRDLYTRVVHGAALSLQATVIAVAVALVAGGLLGLVAGFAGRWVDEAVMRFVDVLLAVPPLLLALALITALGYGTVNIAVAVGVASVAQFARIMRSEVLRVSRATYVEAARAVGTRWWVSLARHVLPNAARPVLALSVLEFGLAVLAVSALSFLGYGVPPPAPEWGGLVSEGRNYPAAWWLCALPGAVIAATVLAVGRISRALDGEVRR